MKCDYVVQLCAHVKEVFFLFRRRCFFCGDKGWVLFLKRLLSVGKRVFFFQEDFFFFQEVFFQRVFISVFFVFCQERVFLGEFFFLEVFFCL